MARPKKQKLSPSPEEAGDVKAFWDQQATLHKGSDLATNPDQHYRTLEIECILRAVGALEPKAILDVGCGNGFTTKKISEQHPSASVIGVDFSHDMIHEAVLHNAADNIEYTVGDVLSLSRTQDLVPGSYDVVVCTRVLINLANWEEMKVGILEMRKMLKPGGHLILVENVQDGLDNLNSLREHVGLPPIKPRWHNVYIPQPKLTKFLEEIKTTLLDTEYVENIGNMYYIASRVIYAKLCQDQGVEPDYNNSINAIASKLPTMGAYYACSPNFLFVLRNVGGIPWQSDRKTLS
jgi:ubiquinone/menaquinone biosynthesis C-methylase UbiE